MRSVAYVADLRIHGYHSIRSLLVILHLQRGAVAEWLRRGLQNLVHRFNSGPRLQVARVVEW